MTKWIINVDGVGYDVEAAGVMSALAMVLGAHSRTNDKDIEEILMVQETVLERDRLQRETNATSELSQEESKVLSPSSSDVSPPEPEETSPAQETSLQTDPSSEPAASPASNRSPKSKRSRSRSRRSATPTSS